MRDWASKEQGRSARRARTTDICISLCSNEMTVLQVFSDFRQGDFDEFQSPVARPVFGLGMSCSPGYLLPSGRSCWFRSGRKFSQPRVEIIVVHSFKRSNALIVADISAISNGAELKSLVFV